MGNFCILKWLGLALLSSLGFASGQAEDPSMLARDLVSETLIRGLEATEVRPVPAISPACLLIAGIQGRDGALVVGPQARLLIVAGNVQQDILQDVSEQFGGSGLKVGLQLIRLVSALGWTDLQGGKVLTLGFERGQFEGFSGSVLNVVDQVRVARYGEELCVATSWA